MQPARALVSTLREERRACRLYLAVRNRVLCFRCGLLPCGARSVNTASFLRHVIHEQILAECIRRSEVSLPTADFGHLLHEMDQAVIACQHERVDDDAGFAALGDFLERLRDDERIEAESVLIDAAIFER